MKVSIIVPVYNVEKYINRCFNSIICQSYTNIECIFIDDCSPDNSYQILRQRINEYQGNIYFNVIRHSKNKGLSGARNTGTLASTGDYIYYLDSDDEITNNCIEILVNLANKYPGVEIIQGNTKTIPQPKSDWRNIRLKNFPEFVNNKLWIKKHCLIEPKIPVNAWNKLIKKNFLTENNLFFLEKIVHEDVHWMFYVAKKIKSISFTEKYCYFHYIVQGSIMQTVNNEKSIKSMLYIIKNFSLNIDNELSRIQKKYLFDTIRKQIAKIDTKKNENKYIPHFRSIVIKSIMNSVRSYKILEVIALLTLLMPHYFLKTFLGRNISKLCIKLV
jgi:glycosyltransferase involved in cell wall biosynthesis